MPNDVLTFSSMQWLLTWAATYLIHSTVLLLGTFTVLRLARTTSSVLTERMWKFAAVTGVLTSVLQVAAWNTSSVLQFQFALPATENAPAIVAPIQVVRAKEDAGEFDRQAADNSIANLHDGPPSMAPDVELPEVVGGVGLPAPNSLRASVPETLHKISVETATPVPVRFANPAFPQEDTDAVIGTLPALVASNETPDRTDLRDTHSASIESDGDGDGRMDESESASSESASTASNSDLSAALITGVSVLAIAFSIGLLRLALLSRRFRNQLREFRVIETGAARKCLNKLASKAKLGRSIVLLESSNADEPMAFGVFRWRIVIPRGVEDSLAADELRALLAHEMAHLVRGDGWWLWIGRVLCSCLNIQPLNVLARRRWQSAGEYQCDTWAVEHLVKPLALARCLTSVAQWKIARRSALIGSSVSGHRGSLSDRIERLATRRPVPDPWKGRRRVQIVGGLAVLTLLTLFGPRFEFVGLNQAIHAEDARSHDEHARSPSRSSNVDADRSTSRKMIRDIEDDADEDVTLSVIRLIRELDQLRDETRSLDARLQGLSTDSAAQELGNQVRERSAILREHAGHVVQELSESDPQPPALVPRQ